MRATVDASHTISPPERSVSTSVSPSVRWLLTDMVRPVAKKTSSACAGAALARTAVATTEARTVLIRFGSTTILTDGLPCSDAPSILADGLKKLADGLDKNVKHPDPQLARI